MEMKKSYEGSSLKKHKNQSSGCFPNWLELPEDITLGILKRLEVRNILEVVQFVCMSWYNICKDPSMWRVIRWPMQSYPCIEMFCRIVVDRSCGQVNDIVVGRFGTDDLLQYIVDRSPQIRSLRIAFCCKVTKDKVVQISKKLPNLEELGLALPLPKEVVESFGHNCPKLKSLDYFSPNCHKDDGFDGAAIAIAQTMPGLRHLWLYENKLTNVGLRAILDHCSHLKSLNIRKCSNVKLEDFGRTFAQRVKNLCCGTNGD